MKRLLRGLILGIAVTLLTALPVLAAYTYYSTIGIVESGGIAYNMVGMSATVDNDFMADNSFMLASGLDTRVLDGAGNEIPRMVVDDRIMFADGLAASSSTNFKYTLGNTAGANFHIIPGFGGSVSTADNATLELSNNFMVVIDGYFDINETGVIVVKSGSFGSRVSAPGTITSSILAAEAADVSQTSSDSYSNGRLIGATYQRGQSFTVATSGYMSGIDVYCTEVGTAPAGNVNFYLYNVSGGNPTGSPIRTTSVDATAVTDGAYQLFTFEPLYVTVGETYAWLAYEPEGTSTNCIAANFQAATNTYGGGQFYTYNGTIWTPTAADDMRFRTYVSAPALSSVAAGLTSGEHKLEVYADTANFKTDWDDVAQDSDALGGVSAIDTAYDFYWLSDSVPYAEYIKLTTGGTLRLTYQPATMIIGTTLIDETNAFNGVIDFGSNPAGMASSMGSLISVNVPEIQFGADDVPIDAVPAITQPGWTSTSNMSANPLYPMIHGIDVSTDFTESQLWVIMGFGIILMGMVTVFKFIPHLLIVSLTGLVLDGLCVSFGIFPWWTLFVFALMVAACLTWERTPNV